VLPHETPQYASSGPIGGVDPDAQTLGGGNQYAILIAGGPKSQLAARHNVNLGRIYDTLLQSTPASQIVVLYSDGIASLGFDDPFLPDSAELGDVPVNGSATRQNWLKALNGELFGSKPTPGIDKLLIYATGHGGQVDSTLSRPQPDGKGAQRYRVNVTDAFRQAPPTGGEAGGAYAPQLLGDRDESEIDRFTIYSAFGLDFDTLDLFFNGVEVDPLFDPNPRPLPYLGATFAYSFEALRSSVLGLDPEGISIRLEGLPDSFLSTQLITGLSILAGDQEYVALPVPEPSAALPLAMALALTFARRLRFTRRC